MGDSRGNELGEFVPIITTSTGRISTVTSLDSSTTPAEEVRSSRLNSCRSNDRIGQLIAAYSGTYDTVGGRNHAVQNLMQGFSHEGIIRNGQASEQELRDMKMEEIRREMEQQDAIDAYNNPPLSTGGVQTQNLPPV